MVQAAFTAETQQSGNATQLVAATANSTARKNSFRKKPRRKKTIAPTVPTILVVGVSKRSQEVRATLEEGLFYTASAEDENSAATTIGENTLAVVVADTPRGRSPVSVCKYLKEVEEGRDLPVFFVLSSRGIEAFERKLYVSGCDAIFEYPREKKDIPRLISQYLQSQAKTPSTQVLDKKLEKDVKSRVSAEKDVIGTNLKVSVYQGIVSVRGSLDAYWKLRHLERALAALPNVSALLTSAITLNIKKKNDRQLERDIRGLISVSSELHNRTLDISVSEGHVTIRGSAKDAAELERLEELISQMKAVCGVSVVVVVSEQQSKRDSTFASSLNRRLLAVFPESDIRASVFGGVAVLRGKVASLAQALDASKAANRVAGIKRVVNKLQIQRH